LCPGAGLLVLGFEVLRLVDRDALDGRLGVIVEDNHRFMAERMTARVRSHPVDHTPPVTAPSYVLDIIHEAIDEVTKG
jgi:hypothetical protein